MKNSYFCSKSRLEIHKTKEIHFHENYLSESTGKSDRNDHFQVKIKSFDKNGLEKNRTEIFKSDF